jgi:predicted AlkP superfamily pyrophosphatase or phosphodiesterase
MLRRIAPRRDQGLNPAVLRLAVLGWLICAAVDAAGEQQPRSEDSRPDRLILISIDGLVPDYYLNPDKYGLKVPALREMVARGAAFAGAEGVFPTVTYPNHMTVVTGARPAEHGIVTNTPHDPFNRTNSGWYWYSEDIKVPTLWDVAREARRTTAIVSWPVSIGAKVDHNFPEYRVVRSEDDVKLIRALSTPGLVTDFERRHGRIPGGARITDRTRAQMAAYIIERHRPDLLLVHLTDLDGAQHRNGPGSAEAMAVLEEIDRHLDTIRGAAQRAATAEHTAWIIVSDHGFREIAWQFHPRAALRSLGYLTYGSNNELADWRIDGRAGGGYFALVARDAKDTQAQHETTRFFEMLAADPRFGIAKLYSPAEMRELGAFPDAFLVGEAADRFAIGGATSGAFVTPATDKGAHGYHPARPDQLASLLLHGKGIRAGTSHPKARLLDVAPTAAWLLGLSMPSARGTVLRQALIGGSSDPPWTNTAVVRVVPSGRGGR